VKQAYITAHRAISHFSGENHAFFLPNRLIGSNRSTASMESDPIDKKWRSANRLTRAAVFASPVPGDGVIHIGSFNGNRAVGEIEVGGVPRGSCVEPMP
jgi:hypothetical protein